MASALKLIPLFIALSAAPALAAPADPHAGHHPEAAPDAKSAAPASPAAPTPEAKPAMTGCMMMGGKTPAGTGADGKMMAGKMMMDPKDMPCMAASSAPKAAEPPHDHDHPAAPAK